MNPSAVHIHHVREPLGTEKQNQSLYVGDVTHEALPCFVQTRQTLVSCLLSPSPGAPPQLQTCLDEPGVFFLLPTGSWGQAGCGEHSKGCQLGTEGAVQDTSWRSAQEYTPSLLPPKSPAVRAEAPSKQLQEWLLSSPLHRHFHCQEAARIPCAPLFPSSVHTTMRPPLPLCAFTVIPRGEPSAAGAKLPPTSQHLPAASTPFQDPAQQRKGSR